MALTRYRLGDLITQHTENNRSLTYGPEYIRGVNTQGQVQLPKGDVSNVDLRPYKIVRKGAVVYNPSRLNIGSIACFNDELCIVSHLYIVFYLNDIGKKVLDSTYLYMLLRRAEFYREVEFRNFGSQRPEFGFKKLADLVVDIPPIDVQRKYVEVYRSMVANQHTYEQGLDDLELVCEAELDSLKHSAPRLRVGDLLHPVDIRNRNGEFSQVMGVNVNKEFMPSRADLSKVNLANYKVVKPNCFACNLMHIGRDVVLPIALFRGENPILVSPAYFVLETNPDSLALPEYIMLWFSRSESDRYGWFACDSSVRGGLDLPVFFDIKIPVPDAAIQQSIVDIYNCYLKRREINERLKVQIRDICPILIRGSLLEGSR